MKTSNRSRCLLSLAAALPLFGVATGAWVAGRPDRPTNPSAAIEARGPRSGQHSTGKVQFDLLAKLLADDRRGAPADGQRRERNDKGAFRVATQAHPLLGHHAPPFVLRDHLGRRWGLQEQIRRGPVVLVFYLGYTCNACVHTLFEANADLARFRGQGAEVVAVSGDSPDLTRRRFERYGSFAFPVLSDPGHVVARSYGTFRPAERSAPEESLHGTFLIGRDGKVCWANTGDTPVRIGTTLLDEIARLDRRSEP